MLRRLVFFVFFWGLCRSIDIPPEFKAALDAIHDTCINKMGLTEADFSAFDIKNKEPKLMCYLQCILQEGRWMNGDEILFDHIAESLPPEVKDIAANNVGKCRNEGGADGCERAYNFNLCISQVDPENWYLV